MAVDGTEPTVAVVGGGLHGVCVAAHLRAAGLSVDDVCVLDPHPELLARFTERARRCGTRTLRSSVAHHVGADYSLVAFADDRDRTVELVSTTDYPRRPTLELFLDHARHVVARQNLDDCHVQTTVTGVAREGDGYRLSTRSGPVVADRVVLAVGVDAGLTYPEWARGLPATAPVTHVWADDATASRLADRPGRVAVVGGGVTASQFACRLATDVGTETTLLCRRPLRVQQAEAPAVWTEWDHLAETLHTLPPGSAARHRLVRSARADGTVPPYLKVRLAKARDRGRLAGHVREVTAAAPTDDGVRLRLSDGTTAVAGTVVLATGLESVSTHPLVARVGEELELARDGEGYPVACDRTLAWRRRDGGRSGVFPVGAAAVTTLGPLASNLAGARLAADRLVPQLVPAEA